MPLSAYLTVSAIVFVFGIVGIFLNRRNIILMLMSLELLLLAANINFVAYSVFLKNLLGQVFSMFILTIAAAEAAIGLAILVIYFRTHGNASVDQGMQLKG